VSGDVELMQDLSQHVYEDREYGYWRTHPYFEERMQKALAATDPGGAPPNEAEIRAYREQVQNRLSALAGSIQDEKTALFLYRSALRAGPGGASSLEVAHKVLQKRSERQRRKKEVLRSYGPLIADYDSLLTLAAGYSGNLDSEIQSLKAERDDLEQERDELYPRSVEIVDDPEAGVQFLELFVENFPDDPRTVQIRFRLAEHYRLLDRADDAAIELDQLLRDLPAEAPSPVVPASAPPPDELASVSLDPENAVLPRAWGRKASSGDENPADDWKTRSLSALRRILPETRELTTNQRIVDETPSDSVRTWARTHLETLAAGLDSLEIGSRFLEAYPKSDLADVVQQKVEKLAETRYYQARLYESLHRFQAALDQYNALILLAPGTRAAQLAREGIERVQTLAGG
jgi:tetratricopeptide (TPR) repeat protein